MDLDALFEKMAVAVSGNDHERFDELERQLLDRFEGGFSGMPQEIYDRYLELDRSWAVRPTQSARRHASGGATPSSELGPRTPLTARLPEVLTSWLREVATTTGSSRSDVLAVCLQLIRTNPAIEKAVIDELMQNDG